MHLVDCLKPAEVSHGAITISGTTYGQSVTYKCDDAYFISSGNVSRKCAADAKWTGSSPTCTEKCMWSEVNIVLKYANKYIQYIR